MRWLLLSLLLVSCHRKMEEMAMYKTATAWAHSHVNASARVTGWDCIWFNGHQVCEVGLEIPKEDPSSIRLICNAYATVCIEDLRGKNE